MLLVIKSKLLKMKDILPEKSLNNVN